KNKNLQRFIFLAIALVVAIWFGKNKYTEWKIEKDEKIQTAKKQEDMERLVKQMVLKYNANTEWPDRISDNKRIPYSIELQDIMIRENRPILLYARLYDIVNKNNKFMVHFKMHLSKAATSLVFILECNLDRIKIIKEANPQSMWPVFGKYAIIAKVSEIQKQEHQEDGDSWKGFIISGKCLDLLYVSRYYDFKKWGL